MSRIKSSSATPDSQDRTSMRDMFNSWLATSSTVGHLSDDLPTRISMSPKNIKHKEDIEGIAGQIARRMVPKITDSDQSFVPLAPTTVGKSSHRRGHLKSRFGCVTCKQRRIKCQETWPSCANCVKRGTPCRYPNMLQHAQRARLTSELLDPCPDIESSVGPHTYSTNDIRLFHHYLMTAYPCLPHNYKSIWIREVPRYSHAKPYLMSAMLALAGTHLALHTDNFHVKLGLFHRQKAITGLEEAFKNWPPSSEEAHCMLAASYLLAFQSGYLEDGLLEHILSLRGCVLLSQLVCDEGLKGPFVMPSSLHSTNMNRAFKNFPHFDQALAHEALQSISNFAHLVGEPTVHALEKTIVAQFVETVQPLLEVDNAHFEDTMTPGLTDATTEATSFSEVSTPSLPPDSTSQLMNPIFPAHTSPAFDEIDWETITVPSSTSPDPIRSFNAMMSTLLVLSTCPYDELVHVFSPTNQLGNVIMAHFCAVRFVISPLSAPKNACRTPIGAKVQWLARILAAVKDDERVQWTQYVMWPRKILRCLQACLEMKRSLSFGDLYEILVHDPGAFKEGRAGLLPTQIFNTSKYRDEGCIDYGLHSLAQSAGFGSLV